MLPIVAALKQRPDCRGLVPRELWKYFDEPLLTSAWYPERDYWVLLSALVKTIDPQTVGGNVWRYFAKYSARRDIGGVDVNTDGPLKSASSGVYRNFAMIDASDPAHFFRRGVQLWSQYHDTGYMRILGGRRALNAVVVQLTEFVIPIAGFVELQGYFLEEYAALVGIQVASVVTRNTASGDAYCEWEYRLGRSPQTEAFVASLPSV